MRTNVKAVNTRTTYGGSPAHAINPLQELRRTVLACLLFEDQFYESGVSAADRIKELAAKVNPSDLALLAIEARHERNLRHVSLLLVRELVRNARGNPVVATTVERVVSRADEPAELLSLYWKDGKTPIAAQLKKGLARALHKFSEYSLGKYDRDTVIKLRDVIRMVHPQPGGEARSALYKRAVARELKTPDTWEVALSGGADKKETFTRLIQEGRLGYLALIRNLRNMVQAGVPRELVESAIRARANGAERVLPFRFFAAAREAPLYENALDEALVASFEQMPRLAGRTVIVLDVSGSMMSALGGRSTMTRLDAGAALAAVAAHCCEEPILYATAGSDARRTHATAQVPARKGMALRDAFIAQMRTLGSGGIFLKPMLEHVLKEQHSADRVIVITDEQDCAVSHADSPRLAKPFGTHNYLINVASYKNGVGYGAWTHIDGFSENVIRYIHELEASKA
jgi:hypothetical protein